MSAALFPSVQPQAYAAEQNPLPTAREIQWNFEDRAPLFSGGEPVLVEGAEAVQVWAWHALQTPRFRHEIYSWSYASELESLIGQPFTQALKQAEAQRYVSEALMVNPYITGVEDIAVSFADGRMSISCRIRTNYGDREVAVSV